MLAELILKGLGIRPLRTSEGKWVMGDEGTFKPMDAIDVGLHHFENGNTSPNV